MLSKQLQSLLTQAQAAHQRGALGLARSGYAQVLTIEPAHFDALHLSGVVAAQTGDFAQAVTRMSAAILVSAQSAECFFNRARAYEALGQTHAALQDYTTAVALNPANLDAWRAQGYLWVGLQHWADALVSWSRVLALDPQNAAAHYMAGVVQTRLGYVDAARMSFLHALAIQPHYPDAHCGLGNVLEQTGSLDDALLRYQKALALDDTHAASYYGCADVLQRLGRLPESLDCYHLLLKKHPEDAGAYNNRGIVQQELKLWDDAMASFTAAIALNANYAEAHYNRANTRIKKMVSLDAMALAAEDYQRALAIKPEYPDALNNLGSVYKDLHQFAAAEQCFDLALQYQPENADVHWNKALNYLVCGALPEGWLAFEWRWKLKNFSSPCRNFSQPLWLGDTPLAGKTLLLHAEQGLGDTLQFCRYVPMVAALGATVVLQVQPPLVRLLRALAGVSQVIALGDTLPEFDLHCPLLSLPLAFKTSVDSVPASTPYIFADPNLVARWSQVLGPQTQPRIGLVWSGSVVHKNDRNRSLSLQEMVAHLPYHCQYISLQKEVRSQDMQTLQMHPHIKHLGAQLADFSDTAALCALVDAVISVDTSVAHLAGAMGKPLWVLLPYSPDWRWLIGRDDSPWYPSAQLLRALQPGDWNGALNRLHGDVVLK